MTCGYDICASVTNVVREMTGPRCSVVGVHYPLFRMSPAKQETPKTTMQLTRAVQATNTDNYPPLRWQNRLPKYDSQSETTIDSSF